MSEQAGLEKSQLDDYDNPILHSPQSSIWHQPTIEDGQVRFLCGRSREKIRVRERESFTWKRGARQCEFCEAKES